MSGGDNDITSRVEPWDEAKPHWIAIYGFAEDAYDLTPKTPYDGQFIAGENGFDIQARGEISAATPAMGDDAGLIRTHGRSVLAGNFVDPATNPFIESTILASVDLVRQRLLDETIPQILDRSIQAGAYGGPSQDVFQQMALENFDREGLAVSAKVYYENHVRERGAQDAAIGLLAASRAANADQIKLTQANADLLRQLEQLALDEDLKQFEESILAVWRGLDQYTAIMAGGAFTKSTEEGPKKNVIGSVLQGAVGGASAGGSVGGAPGAAIGAILGGLLGGLD